MPYRYDIVQNINKHILMCVWKKEINTGIEDMNV